MKYYDYLIVGSGLYGATFAYRAMKAGKSCLVIDKRSHLGGNVYCEKQEGINVHKYGAHIFHTNNREVWEFVNSIVPFNRYTNSPVANYKGKLYNLPFNMNTFYQMWGVTTPEQAQAKIEEQREEALEQFKQSNPQGIFNGERPAVTGFGDNPSCAETAVLNHGIDIPSLRSRFQILSMQKTVLSAFVHRDLPPD